MSTKHKTVIERVSDIEEVLEKGIPQALNQRFTPLLQTVNALMELVGKESVITKIKEMESQRQTDDMEAKKGHLLALVAEGRLVASQVVKETSVVVGQEISTDGTVVHPGRFQMAFTEVAPTFQAQLLGKGSGAELEIPNYGKFVVQEIYDFVPPAVPAAVVETPNS